MSSWAIDGKMKENGECNMVWEFQEKEFLEYYIHYNLPYLDMYQKNVQNVRLKYP